MSIALRKEIMKRSKIKKKYNKKRNYENWSLYKKQRNYCLLPLRKTKKAYFEKMNIKEIGDDKTFWETSSHISIIKTINLLKLPLLKKILLWLMKKELQD